MKPPSANKVFSFSELAVVTQTEMSAFGEYTST